MIDRDDETGYTGHYQLTVAVRTVRKQKIDNNRCTGTVLV